MPKLLYWPYLGVNFVFKDPNFEDPHIKNFDTLTVWWIVWLMIYVKVSGWFSFKLLSGWCRMIQRQIVKNLWQWKELGNAWLFISSALVAKAIRFFSMEEIVTTNSCRFVSYWPKILISITDLLLYFQTGHSFFRLSIFFLCSQDFQICNAAF